MIHFAGMLGFGDLASLAEQGSLFAGAARDKLEQLQAELQPLAERYDVVVANPPYMGSSSLGKWNGKWIKDNFPEAYRDLCTSFIDRGFSLSNNQGYSAMVTMQSWMFLGSYEKLREKLLRNHTISSMAHLGTRAFGAIGGEVVSTTATVFANKKYDVPGTYLRLVDMGSEQEKAAGALEALANPECGWLYKRAAAAYFSIPGSPIAYWASNAVIKAFGNPPLGDVIPVKKGLDTGDNDKYLRLWHEPSFLTLGIGYKDAEEFHSAHARWAPHDKGGEFRRWYGNKDWVIDWAHNGSSLRASSANLRSEQYYFHNAITWCSLSSGLCSFRLSDYGAISNTAGSSMYPATNGVLYLGLMNSSVVQHLFSFLAPTLNYSAGPVGLIPKAAWRKQNQICDLVEKAIELTKVDWDSFEESWDFKKHPLL